MPIALLFKKLNVPVLRTGRVVRPRPNERLDASLERKLTLTCAPAGFGKTALLAAWAHDCTLPVAWLDLDEGEAILGLLYKAGERVIAPEYVGRLLAVSSLPETLPKAGTPESLLEPLSPRELEVLELISGGLSNREIAGKLVIALSTVKGHTASIYGKLGVRSRTQALTRARQPGVLVEPR